MTDHHKNTTTPFTRDSRPRQRPARVIERAQPAVPSSHELGEGQ